MLQGRLTMLNTNSSQENARWNENVVKSFLEEYIGWAERTCMGDRSRRAAKHWTLQGISVVLK